MKFGHNMREQEIRIDAGGPTLTGDLVVPRRANGIILFAHGSVSSRMSARNRAVARALEQAGMATMLLDLLTPLEDECERAGALLRLDVQRLAHRFSFAIDWLARDERTSDLPLGLFGSSTGAAVALIAAAMRPTHVGAVVSRGGRPDLAESALEHVSCPTRLIVGGDDDLVLELNRRALRRLTCTKDLVVVPGATHLFEEPGALEEVARMTTEWFAKYPCRVGRFASDPGEDFDRQSLGFRVFAAPVRARPTLVVQQPEILFPRHDPPTRTPQEQPAWIETPTMPSSPDPRPAPALPEFEPYRGRR